MSSCVGRSLNGATQKVLGNATLNVRALNIHIQSGTNRTAGIFRFSADLAHENEPNGNKTLVKAHCSNTASNLVLNRSFHQRQKHSFGTLLCVCVCAISFSYLFPGYFVADPFVLAVALWYLDPLLGPWFMVVQISCYLERVFRAHNLSPHIE